jgi:MFS family permease
LSVIFSIVFYGWQPLQNSLIAKYTTKKSHGKGYGMNFFLIMGMGSVATAVGGYIADNQGVSNVYFMLAVISIIALIISLTVMRYMRYALRVSFAVEKDRTY